MRYLHDSSVSIPVEAVPRELELELDKEIFGV